MKAANFVNVLLAIALVFLCIELNATRQALAELVTRESRAESVSHAENAEMVSHAESAEFVSHAESAENAESGSHAESAEFAEPAPGADAASVTVDSTGLAPGVSGFGGPVPVLVEVKDGIVASVSPKLPNDETPGFFKRLEDAGLWKAWDGLPVEVAATVRVDAVTSATYSSEAAIANVRAALAAAARPQDPAEDSKAEGGAPADGKAMKR